MDFADVHAHLELIDSDKLEAALKRAEETGVKAVITNSTDLATGKKALEMQDKFPMVKAALGIYPVNAATMNGEDLQESLGFIRSNSSRIAAIGEIGLDYQETKDRENQQLAFELQLRLAKKLDIPVIVHSRKAENEVVQAIVSSACSKVVLHAFHGSMKLAKQAADAGISFSIPSNIARSSHFQKMAETLPVERILTETDAPYLGPGKDGRSEPAFVALTVKKIAEIKNMKVEEAASEIYGNYEKLFEVG